MGYKDGRLAAAAPSHPHIQMRFVVNESLSGLVASCRTSTPSTVGAGAPLSI